MASLVIRVMQIKITRYYYVKWKLPITVSVGEEVEQLKLSYIAAGNTKCPANFGKTVRQFLMKLNIYIP